MRTGCHAFPLPADTPAATLDRPDLLAALRQAGVHTRLIVDTSRPTVAAFESGWDAVQHVEGLAALVEHGRQALDDLAAATGPALLWLELASLLPPWEVADEFIDPYFAPPPIEQDEDEEEDEYEEDEPGEVEEEEEEEPLDPIFDPPSGAIDTEDDDLYLAIQTTFAAALSQQDAALAELLDGLPDDVAVLFTSDHGQALGEHGVVGAVRPFLHAEVVQVPLLLRLPGRLVRRRIGELTLSVDLAPTIADLLGATLPGAHGRSLLALTGLEPRGADATPLAWREYACLGTQVGNEIEWALWTANRSLRVPIAGRDGVPRLYIKPDDRCEVNDVLHHHLEEAEAMERALRACVEAAARPGPLELPPLQTVSS
jgi:hypothetical protein